MAKWLALLAILLALPPVLGESGAARGAEPEALKSGAEIREGPALSAQSAILIDAESGQVLYEHEADAVREPASLTKIMTGLLVVEDGRLDHLVTVSKRAADTGEASVNLQAGDQVRVRDLLAAVLLSSANDASVAVAEYVGGSLSAFVDRMNARAAELGLHHTRFTNPHGLPTKGHVSTARELALLAREAMRYETFRQIVSKERADFIYQRPGVKGVSSREILTTNRLLRRGHPDYWEFADGVKTGYTRAAGRCLCASATKDGWQLLAVVLGCEDCWEDGRTLLKWGFEHFHRVEPVTAQVTEADVHVIDGQIPLVRAVANSSIRLVTPVWDAAPRLRLSETYAEAPIRAGDEVGELIVERPDGTQLSATLVASRDVPRSWSARLRDHAGAMTLGVVALAFIGAILAHGVVAEAASARWRRGASFRGRDGKGRTSDGQRTLSGLPGTKGRPRSRRGPA